MRKNPLWPRYLAGRMLAASNGHQMRDHGAKAGIRLQPHRHGRQILSRFGQPEIRVFGTGEAGQPGPFGKSGDRDLAYPAYFC